MFNQVFADPDAYSLYREGFQAIEIVGSPQFHRLHWEALKDPETPLPLAIQAPVIRRRNSIQTAQTPLLPSPTINILLVTARPYLEKDIAYRTISRPLIEGLREADVSALVDIVRPGTYEALVTHLEKEKAMHGSGYYHMIHFDVHGSLLAFEQYQVYKILRGNSFSNCPNSRGCSRIDI